jgi:type IX secretion system PorP/SprF family membrane protein
VKKIKIILYIFSFLFLQDAAKAQQGVQFSQYAFNQLALNNAYAGYRGATTVSAGFRSQWVGIKGAPQTGFASLDLLLPDRQDNVALSVKLLTDKLGPQQTTSFLSGYTYRIQMDAADTRRLCLGIGAGFSQYSIDGNAYEYVDPNDPMVAVGRRNSIVPDANFGIYYYTPKFYISLGANNILTYNNQANANFNWLGESFYSMEKSIHAYAGAGYLFNLSDNVKFKPSFLWKEDFKGPSNADLNASFLLHDLVWIGASYRTAFDIWRKGNLQTDLEKTNALAIMAEMYASPVLRIGYAYDITTSKLNSYQNGTHELSVSFSFTNKEKSQTVARYF